MLKKIKKFNFTVPLNKLKLIIRANAFYSKCCIIVHLHCRAGGNQLSFQILPQDDECNLNRNNICQHCVYTGCSMLFGTPGVFWI